MIKELKTPIPQYSIGNDFFPKGSCLAYFLVSDSIDYNNHFIVCMDDGGYWFQIPWEFLRGIENHSYGRSKDKSFALSAMECGE
jgi:hypothetical protein